MSPAGARVVNPSRQLKMVSPATLNGANLVSHPSIGSMPSEASMQHLEQTLEILTQKINRANSNHAGTAADIKHAFAALFAKHNHQQENIEIRTFAQEVGKIKDQQQLKMSELIRSKANIENQLQASVTALLQGRNANRSAAETIQLCTLAFF